MCVSVCVLYFLVEEGHDVCTAVVPCGLHRTQHQERKENPPEHIMSKDKKKMGPAHPHVFPLLEGRSCGDYGDPRNVADSLHALQDHGTGTTSSITDGDHTDGGITLLQHIDHCGHQASTRATEDTDRQEKGGIRAITLNQEVLHSGEAKHKWSGNASSIRRTRMVRKYITNDPVIHHENGEKRGREEKTPPNGMPQGDGSTVHVDTRGVQIQDLDS